ncbi:MAG: ATP-binding protein [Betaproteobacteria bacterium]|nr:ATP-binding protein [Betaproteobacteria bacterium]
MHPRLAIDRLRALAAQFPAVLVLGPRQVGKTTLARMAFADLPYCDLEDPATRALFAEDARFQLEARAQPALILDEAQCVPAVFAALRGAIDAERRRRGRFIILGSAEPTLVRQVAETLAGRVGVVELDPLTAKEAASGTRPQDWRNLWLSGGFPDALHAYEQGGSFRDWWEAYLRAYTERDLPMLGVTAEPLLMRRLLTMLAHSQGGLANYNQLAASLEVSHGTVVRYLDILERSFLLRRVAPYYRNIGKRLVKAPKLYLRDTGLLHHLLNIDSLAALDNHPGRGASWETFVIEDIARRERCTHPHSQIFFWRTAAGAEVDLLLERGTRRYALEVKTARGASPYLARSLRAVLADLKAESATVIDQAAGAEPLAPGVFRRGFAESLDWLPGGKLQS